MLTNDNMYNLFHKKNRFNLDLLYQLYKHDKVYHIEKVKKDTLFMTRNEGVDSVTIGINDLIWGVMKKTTCIDNPEVLKDYDFEVVENYFHSEDRRFTV